MLIFVGKDSDPKAVQFLQILKRLGAETCEFSGENAKATNGMIAVFVHPLGVYKGKHMRTGTPEELRDRGFQIPSWALRAKYCVALKGRLNYEQLPEQERIARLEDVCKVARYKLTGVKPDKAKAHKKTGHKARLHRYRSFGAVAAA